MKATGTQDNSSWLLSIALLPERFALSSKLHFFFLISKFCESDEKMKLCSGFLKTSFET